MSHWPRVCSLLSETDCSNNKGPSSSIYCVYLIQGGCNLFIFYVPLLLFEHLLFCFMDWIQLTAPLILSSDLDLLSHSHVECAQFIVSVSTNRDAPYSIAKSVLIAVQFLFYVILLMVTVSLSYYIPSLPSPFSLQFSIALYAIPLCQVHFYFCLSIPGSPTSASSYCRSGERGSQSRENACVGVYISWWKPPRHSTLDQGKSSAPSA